MIVDRAAGTIAHRTFRELPSLLRSGDTLVLNTTRVFRARLLGTRDGSGAPAEVLLLREHEENRWEAMVQPGAKLKPGRVVSFGGEFEAEMLGSTDRGTRFVQLRAPASGGDDAEGAVRAVVHAAIAAHGHIPLPPYIARADTATDAERYQTVYSREEGSVAAPTAGLHFTPDLLETLRAQGVGRAEVLLHVGAGTFKPVEVDDPAEHQMHEEWFRVSEVTADALNATRARGGRICAVGTTALRTLESVLAADGRFRATTGETQIFLRPPQRPRGADVLLTNFHLPRSTLLMLVAAVAGYPLTMHAYEIAVREGYRFYSYGDAMLIV